MMLMPTVIQLAKRWHWLRARSRRSRRVGAVLICLGIGVRWRRFSGHPGASFFAWQSVTLPKTSPPMSQLAKPLIWPLSCVAAGVLGMFGGLIIAPKGNHAAASKAILEPKRDYGA